MRKKFQVKRVQLDSNGHLVDIEFYQDDSFCSPEECADFIISLREQVNAPTLRIANTTGANLGSVYETTD